MNDIQIVRYIIPVVKTIPNNITHRIPNNKHNIVIERSLPWFALTLQDIY